MSTSPKQQASIPFSECRRVANKLAKIRNLVLEIRGFSYANGTQIFTHVDSTHPDIAEQLAVMDEQAIKAMSTLGYSSAFGKFNAIRAKRNKEL